MQSGRPVSKSDERSRGESDFTILHDGHYLAMLVKTRDKTFNITCFQISSLTSENSIIHWNPVCLIEQGIHKGFAVLVSTYDNDNSLRDLLNECTTRCCVACIIVNPDEKFELLVTNVDLTQYNIPIYVIKKTDGKRIQDVCHSERDVHVRTEQSSELQKSSSLLSKFGKRLIRHTKIPEQLIKYICESWQADISFERAKDLFVQVILYLQKCDDDGRRHNFNFNMNDVFAHLFSAPIFTNVFSVTLPVYVYILAHIVSNEEVYLYNESGIAVDRVMQKCGVLIRSNPQTVMETIALYRPEKISGSLKIRWKNVGYSFLNLLDYWTTTKQQLPSDFFAKAIPMIIIAQTILKEAGESRSELQKQWGTHLLKYSEKANFRQGGSAGNHIQWLEEGLQFQVKIKSPSDCYFMPKHLKELVNPGRKLCTLLEARNVLLTLPKQLEYEWKTDFLVEFIMPLRASYRVVLKDTKYKDFRTVSSQGEWTGMITEGVGFIIAIEQFMKDSNCKEYFADKSFKWLKLLVRSVPFDQVQSENHTRYIDLLFSEETVIMKHCEEVKQMLLVKFRESLKSLTPNRFLLIEKYTKSKKITDDSIFKEYFQNCEIRVNENDLVCSKSEYLSVIQARVSRNPLGKQSDILEFFELVSKFYEKGDCPSDLFLDLVQLNVKGLLTSSTDSSLMETDETEFYQFLHKKNKPHVSNAILKELPTFIELPTRETTNPFQWLVCRVILEGLGGINFTKDLPLVKSTLEAVKDHFEVATRTLTADLNTPRIRFACGVLQLFTSKVSFRKESWVSDSPVSVLDLVTTIAPLFEKCQGITSGVPQEVQYCLSFFTDVRTRFESLDDLLRSECISYTTLEDLFKRNYEIKSVVEVVKPRGNKDIDFQTFDALYHKCLQIREDISHLVLLRCKIGVAKTVCYDSLMRVLGKYSVELPQELKKELLEIIDVELIEELIKDGSVEIEIPFNGAKTCVQLEILQRNLSTFLGPIKGKLPVFCFFHHFKSSFFSNFVKKKYSEFLFVPLADNVSLPESSSHDSCIEMLNLAVESAINTVVDAVKGNVTLQQMELDLSQDTSAEFAIFEFYVKEFCNCCEHKGHEGIDALLSLANIRNGMLSIEEVCTQCELVHCLENPTFRELSMYAEMLRTPEKIVLNQAPEIKAKFCQSLPNYDGDFDIYFMLFKELKNSFAYIHFCRKMGFVGEEGKRSFYAQRNLVTQEIQYMLEQTALDDLWDAYTTLYYFIDSSITYNAWMNGLEQLGNIQTRVNQIKALRQHSLVQLERIFNRQESLTKEIISKKLCNMFDGASVVYSAEKHAPVTMEVQMNYEGIEEKWDLKTLSEFAANVELLQIDLKDELDSELDNNIHLFLKIYEVSLNILELLKMLKLAGNFKFQEVNYSHKFSGQDLKWDNLINQFRKELHKWASETPVKRQTYPMLSFFSNLKIFQIYQFLESGPSSSASIINAIAYSMLYAGTQMSDKQKQIIETAVKHKQVEVSEDIFSTVGYFIHHISKHFIPQHLLVQPRHQSFISSIETNFFRIYSMLGSSNYEVYNVAFNLLGNRLPNSFQVLACTYITTQEAVTLFFERLKNYPYFRYIMIDVNILSLDIQEIVIKECVNLLEYGNKKEIKYDVVFIETCSSVMRTMPWCLQDHLSYDEQMRIDMKSLQKQISCELVYGHAGNGKSHYIKNMIKMKKCEHLTFPINEGFDVQKCIRELNEISQTNDECVIHINFTLPFIKAYAVTEDDKKTFEGSCKLVNWFFFSMLISGYVEAYQTGESFSLNQFKKLHIFVEIPVLIQTSDEEAYLTDFNKHFPVFSLIGTKRCISSTAVEYDAQSEDTMLVCKYLKAKEQNKLDKLHKVPTRWERLFYRENSEGVRIGDSADLSSTECVELLYKIMPPHVKARKLYQRMFVRYMYRRCHFMEESYHMRYFEGKIPSKDQSGQFIQLDAKNLRSSLLDIMKNEVSEMCLSGNDQGFQPPHMQLIYDGGAFSVLSRTGRLSNEESEIIDNFGFNLPNPVNLKDQKVLQECLCTALQIRKDPSQSEISVLKNQGYVLTLDYLLKMLSVHERQQCGMPVVISGETGVGKTFLLETLSKLYNHSYQQSLSLWREHLLDYMKQLLPSLITSPDEVTDIVFSTWNTEESFEIMLSSLSSPVKEKFLEIVLQWFHKMQTEHDFIRVFPLIEFLNTSREIPQLFDAERVTSLLLTFLYGKQRLLFQVKKVHSGLTPSEIREFLQPLIKEEESLKERFFKRPKLTIFFDEVNTCSCPGFLKEIIIDHSMDGKPLPENIFIVAACNPHRTNSLCTLSSASSDTWFKGDYLVRPLHPSFKLLMWDFGSLEENQERDYIQSKFTLLDGELTKVDGQLTKLECETLIEKISLSQNLIRRFTKDYLIRANVTKADATAASFSSVSQRDIQRVLKLYMWLKTSFKVLEKYGYSTVSEKRSVDNNWQLSVRALFVSLALVYYFRLNANYRKEYADLLDANPFGVTQVTESGCEGTGMTFTKALKDELDWLMENIELPIGVADTQALRENLYAIIVCCMTRIPLIIIGPPGCSKTLSFKIALANLQGEVSPKQVFRHKIMKSLDPHIYQCSKHSTTEDINTLFEKATSRQEQIDISKQSAVSVVFMDEAGLPEDNLQVLKVLHYHLDNPEVSFVALTNTIFDAAKSNRAVCLFQVNTSDKDLQQLAGALMGYPDVKDIPETIKEQLRCITSIYSNEMLSETFSSMFGLRDLMHFFSYIRKNMLSDHLYISPELLLRSLQRNFLGAEDFNTLAGKFLSEFGLSLDEITSGLVQSPLIVLKSSLADKPEDLSFENEVRYKLLIDHSEDESLVRFLFKFGILKRTDCRIYALSKLPGDKLQKAMTVARVTSSIIRGHTVVLSQCDEIQESFYDLFNQRFTCIDDFQQKTNKYYARIATGTTVVNCLVHPDFQCVVVVKYSELQDTPAPFMNRFEKFHLSHDTFLSELKKDKNPLIALLLEAKEKVKCFIEEIPPPGIYGQQEHTLLSLVMTHIKMTTDAEGRTIVDSVLISPSGEPVINTFTKFLQTTDEEPSEGFEDITYVLSTIQDEVVTFTEEALDRTKQFLKEFNPEDSHEIDIEIYNVLRIISQLLTVRMTKELMQLMPPEVFLAMKEKIPKYYVKAYLKHHTHFSLQDLVKKLMKDMNERDQPNKTLCFSRTTSFLFESLPHEYFSFSPNESRRENRKKLNRVFPDIEDDIIDTICVLQVLQNSVGSDINRKVKRFLVFDRYDVLLLLVNVQEISRETINYLRIMIEELEFELNEHKQFIVFLHFPSENFFKHCYPALFLDGWNHCYLDAIAPSEKTGVIDLKSCFQYCFNDDNTANLTFMEKTIEVLLETEVLAFSAARIGTLQSKEERISRDSAILSSLLSLSGTHSIANSLKVKFCQQWTQAKMMQLLQQAANSAISQEYTLNMTDAINTLLKSSFYDFMHYMATILTKHGALGLLLSNKASQFLRLIQLQIEHYPLPKSSAQMKIESTVTDSALRSTSNFPFFNIVYDAIEDFLKVNHISSVTDISQNHLDCLSEKLKQTYEDKQDIFSITFIEMDKDPSLWSCYMLQFLSLFYDNVKPDSELFGFFHQQAVDLPTQSIFSKLIWLHCSFTLIPMDILNVLRFFSTLTDIDDEDFSLTGDNMIELFANPERLAEKVVNTLFTALTAIAEKYVGDEDLKFEKQIKRMLPKYNSLFLTSPTRELLHVKISPQTEMMRDAIAVFFTLVNVNVKPDMALALLKHFVSKNDAEVEKLSRYRIEYLVKIPVEIVADCPFLQVFSGTSYTETETKLSVRHFVEQIIQILIKSVTTEQREQLISWLIDLCHHHVMQNISCLMCQENESIATLCFLYIFFSSTTTTEGNDDMLHKQVELRCSNTKEAFPYLPYLPYYFQHLSCKKTTEVLNHEPLMSLYFLKACEMMNAGEHDVAYLIKELQEENKNDSLWHCVKKQAMIFSIVTATAENITKSSDILIMDVDMILNEYFGECNGLLLAYEILKCCKSYKQLRKLLLPEHELCKHFTCLTTLRTTYREEQPLFPELSTTWFLELLPLKSKEDNVNQIYSRVSSAIREMVSSSQKDVPRVLLEIMAQCFIKVKNKGQSKKYIFMMSVFLAVYNHFYIEEHQSPEVGDLLKTKMILYMPSTYTNLISLFVGGGRTSSDTDIDQLQTMFSTPKAQNNDIKDMWQCAAHLIASIIGMPDKSNHFWSHLFYPEGLVCTYIPGSTYEDPVGRKMYDEVTVLSDTGHCLSQESFQHITRGTMSLPCLYFIQWANYTCLCVHLLGLSRNTVDSPFEGQLFSNLQMARNICKKRMEKAWILMLKNLAITTEQREMLVKLCVGRILHKQYSFAVVSFNTIQEVNEYEKYFNNDIFIPAWNDMLVETERLKQNVKDRSVQRQLLHLENTCPVFADEKSFMTFILTSTNFEDSSSSFYVLYQFLLMRPILDEGIRILPDLVDFYQWIHTQFPHYLTRKQTETTTVNSLLAVEVSDVGYLEKVRTERTEQFHRICEFTRKYKECLMPSLDLPILDGETVLSNVISFPGTSGILLRYIDKLINVNNSFLKQICQSDFGKGNHYLQRIIAEQNETSSLKISSFSERPISKFDDLTDILPYISLCCCLSPRCFNPSCESDPSLLKQIVPQVYNLHKLQDDVTSIFLSEMKMIKSISAVDMKWIFKNVDESVASIFVESAAVSLGDLEGNIPTDYRVEADNEYMLNVLKHCHSLSYHSLLEMTIGLRIAALYLTHHCDDGNISLRDRIKRQKLPEFLKSCVYYDGNVSNAKILKDVLGIDVYRLNQLQMKFLEELSMIEIMKALQTFVIWLQEGMYDFSSLPVTLKEELSVYHKHELKQVTEAAISEGKAYQFSQEIRRVNQLLAQCELSMRNMAAENKTSLPLKPFLLQDEALDFLPDINVCHYVKLRLALRKIQVDITKRLHDDTADTCETWDDKMSDDVLQSVLNIRCKKTPLSSSDIVVDQNSEANMTYASKGKDLIDLSVVEISEFMRSVGISEKYIEDAKDSEVDGSIISTLPDKPLRQLLGMKKDPVAFLVFKVSIKRCFGGQTFSQPKCSPNQTAEFCRQFEVLKNAADTILQCRIDSEMLINADKEVLEKISTNAQEARKIIEENLHGFVRNKTSEQM